MLPIPLILGIAAGVIGTKVGISALDKFEEAKEMSSKSKKIKETSMSTLIDYKEEASESLRNLGSIKHTIIIGGLSRYAKLRDKIEYDSDKEKIHKLIKICHKASVWDNKLSDEDFDKLFMALGAYGNILYDGKKSVFVDNEIKLLSTVVEEDIEIGANSDLIISSGLGLLGLTVAGLGKFVAAPVFLIGSCLLETKASEDRAYASYMLEEAAEYQKKIELQMGFYAEISSCLDEISWMLQRQKTYLDKQLDKFETTIDICGLDCSGYNEKAIQVIKDTDMLVESIMELIDIEIVDSRGVINMKSAELIKHITNKYNKT